MPAYFTLLLCALPGMLRPAISSAANNVHHSVLHGRQLIR
jgi:hypothetical protein